MKAVVLAAGVGRRLRPFTNLLPKTLLPIRGTPVLETLLRGLGQIGIREVCVVVGHLGDRVRTFAGDGSAFGVRVSYLEQAEPRGTGHALLQAAPFVDDTVMVLAGRVRSLTWKVFDPPSGTERESLETSICGSPSTVMLTTFSWVAPSMSVTLTRTLRVGPSS